MPIYTYLIKVSVALVVFYGVFAVSLRYKPLHQTNRFLLIFILFASIVLPFIEFSFPGEAILTTTAGYQNNYLNALTYISHIEVVSNIENIPLWFKLKPLSYIYICVCTFLLIKLIISYFLAYRLISKSDTRRYNGYVLKISKEITSPFSFYRYIFLSEEDVTNEAILNHEIEHINQKHWLDLLISEVFALLFWFHPITWLIKHDIKLIHEYLADKAVLNSGIDAIEYQLLVLERAVGKRRFALANQFIQKPIKKRLNMIQKKNPGRWASFALILFIPTTFMLLQAFTTPKIEQAIDAVSQEIGKVDNSKVWVEKWSRKILNPESPTYEKVPPIKQRNVLIILINAKNKILSENIKCSKEEVLKGVSNFLDNKAPYTQGDVENEIPEVTEKNIPLLGKRKVSKGIILIQFDKSTDKSFLNDLITQIAEVVLTKRKALAIKEFNQDYFSLSKEQKEAIDTCIPVNTTIAPPKNVVIKSN